MNNLDINNLLWRLMYAESPMTDSEKAAFLSRQAQMPDKGYGCILVEKGRVEDAEAILKSLVDEFEWDYYPEGFITDTFWDEHFYYGKFEIEHQQLVEFYNIMIEKGIVIIQAEFYLPSRDTDC